MSQFIDLPACVITLGVESLNGLQDELELISSDSSITITPDAVTGEIDLVVAPQVDTEVDLGNISGSTNIDFDTSGSRFLRATLTGNTTLTFSSPASTGTYRLLLQQDGTGGRTVALPSMATFRLAAGLVISDIEVVPNGRTLFTLYFRSNALGWLGVFHNFGVA